MLRRAAVLVAALGGSASGAAPITGSTPADEDMVVALAHGSTLICSGAIIGPHAVLTAAHCLVDSSLPDVVEGAAVATGTHHRVVAAFVHPDYDADTFDHDIAVVIVDSELAGAPQPFATTLPPGVVVGGTMRVLGYGWTVANDPLPAERRGGTSRIDAVDSLRIRSSAAPSQACEGDSGGPALVDGSVVGVASSGDVNCTQFARHTRVDAHAAFVADVLARTAAGGAKPGDRCWYDANCETGSCVQALDEPRWSFCSPPCDDGACPAGLACIVDGNQEERCRHPWPSPGADRHACNSDEDCASDLCVAPAGESQAVCATRCFSDLPGFDCPVNTVCRDAADGTEACFAIESDAGGCRVAPGDGGALLAFGVIGLTALVVRRRAA